MATTSGTSSSTVFNGNSRYSSDFQSVVDRAVAIASLPLKQLRNDRTSLQDQSTALGGLDSKVTSVQSALQNLEQAMGAASLQSSVSDSSLVGVSLGSGALEGNYSMEVQDIGAYASSMSKSAWSSTGTTAAYHLTVGSDGIDITPSSNDPAAVAQAINAKAGDKVRATVVNVGSSGSPDYRLVLQATRLGDLTPSLTRNSVEVQQQQAAGRVAKYVVANSGKVVESDTRSVSIADGVHVTLLASKPGSTVDIAVTRSSSALNNALSAFATAYNSAIDAVDTQRGTSTGALAAQAVIYSVSETLRGLATYSQAGSAIGTLADIGLELQKDGHIQYNGYQFLSASVDRSNAITAFLGSAAGGGFLKTAGDAMANLEQTDTGVLKLAQKRIADQGTATDERIALEQLRVDQMQERLQKQMAASDALIAAMEQQYNYIASMFSSMQTAANQYK